MVSTVTTSDKKNNILLYFMLGWMILNIIQACLVGVDGDEAYYWTYSRHLQWGYFDHPPMVALSVKLGELFGHGYFFTRIGTVLFSTATVYFSFKALPDRLQQHTSRFALVFASVLIFHIYGFVATPDAPLLFFTALFFYAYKRYLKEESAANIVFLTLTVIGLIYSKYHGILPVFFTFLSNPRLALKRSAWLIMAFVTIAFLPHLWWQYHHDWPTVRYHLFERSQGSYKIEKTTNYILGQLLILGPFTTLVALIALFRRKTSGDLYFRAHLFTFFGVLIFFLISSFKKNIEPHWTLTAGISLVVLLLDLLERSGVKFRKVFLKLAMANILLILAARILMVLPNTPAKKIDRFQVQFFSKSWADSLYNRAASTPTVFVDNYTYPSLYQYYHPDQLSTCYSSVYYRKNNYNLKDIGAFNNKTIYAIRKARTSEDDVEVKSGYVPTFLHTVDSFKAIIGLKIKWKNPVKQLMRGEKASIILELSNPLHYAINADNLFVNYTFFKTKTDYRTSPHMQLHQNEVSPGFEKSFRINMELPEQPGKYRLIFSFDQRWMGPTFASPFYEVEVL